MVDLADKERVREVSEFTEKVFELFWYSTVVWFAHFFFARLAGDHWGDVYPLMGFLTAVFGTHVGLSLLQSDGTARQIRIGLPSVTILAIWYSGDFGIGIVKALQEQMGILQFVILLGVMVLSIYLSIEYSAEDAPKIKKSTSTRTPVAKNKQVSLGSFDRIVGQEHVISSLKEISKLASANIKLGKDNAPFAVLFFLGPTGVGKTEAARALAEAVYGSSDALIRFDMGQFADSHQANRFYGPPPGYVGYEQGGQLTRAVQRRPRSVVLLDEVEKADPKIWDAFLPVFDEGYIVDGSSNEKVDMRQTLIVLTSNLLSDRASELKDSSIGLKEALQQTGAFRDELIGRINEIFVFNSLDTDSVREILQRRIDAALWNLSERGIQVSIDTHEIDAMVAEIKAAKFGVRQIDDVVRTRLRKIIAENSPQASTLD